MTQKDRMESYLIYNPGDADIMRDQMQCMERLYEYNMTRPSESDKRVHLLKEMFASVGDNCYIEPPLHANWAGKRVRLGNCFYANFNLTLVDDAPITFGDHVMIAPNVTITTATHPICPELREKALQYNREVVIGNNVWIGANVTILPGVKIGDNSVIGACSMVNHDIPANVIAYGTPCRVVRTIGPDDRNTYDHGIPIDWENI